jgi:hypothetical protein
MTNRRGNSLVVKRLDYGLPGYYVHRYIYDEFDIDNEILSLKISWYESEWDGYSNHFYHKSFDGFDFNLITIGSLRYFRDLLAKSIKEPIVPQRMCNGCAELFNNGREFCNGMNGHILNMIEYVNSLKYQVFRDILPTAIHRATYRRMIEFKPSMSKLFDVEFVFDSEL